MEPWRTMFQEAGTPERAAGAKAYLKSNLRFYGVAVPFVGHVQPPSVGPQVQP